MERENHIETQSVDYSIDELKLLVNSPMDNILIHELKRYMHLITHNKNLPGEVFRQHPTIIQLECSNYGRIRVNNGNIIKPVEEKPGWLYIYYNNEKYAVYRMVAETWCLCPNNDCSGWQVHHITNDGYDNTPRNLIWLKEQIHKQIGTPRVQKLDILFKKDESVIKEIIEKINLL